MCILKEDYYETLGVNKSSSDGEIKQAYRKKAMKYHPDRNKDDKQAEKKFKKINEAYYVLKDKEKKSQYDQFGHQAFEHGGAGFKDVNFGNLKRRQKSIHKKTLAKRDSSLERMVDEIRKIEMRMLK